MAPLFIIVYQCFSIQGYGQGTSLEHGIPGWCTTFTPKQECGETRSRSGDDTGLDSLLIHLYFSHSYIRFKLLMVQSCKFVIFTWNYRPLSPVSIALLLGDSPCCLQSQGMSWGWDCEPSYFPGCLGGKKMLSLLPHSTYVCNMLWLAQTSWMSSIIITDLYR